MTDQELIQELEKAATRWEKENPIIGVGELRYCDALRDAAYRLKERCDQLTSLQSEYTEKYGEIEQIAAYEAVYRELTDIALKVSQAMLEKLSRVEAERDALLEYANAQMECETCKHDVFCPLANPMPENCALCELKPKCPCHPCKWEWRGAQGEG